jgi:hypothetical protein
LRAGGPVDAVNVLRGVVCLGIMLKHFSTPAGFAAHWGGWAAFGVLWVPGSECFLVVSGFFLAHMFRPGEAQFLSVPQFARRRGYRLLVPYWVALAVAYLGLVVWRMVVPGPPVGHLYDPRAVAANLLCVPDVFGQPSPMLFFWTVVTLVQTYALWAVGFWVVRFSFLARGTPDYHHRTEGVMIPLTAVLMLVCGGLTWTESFAGWSWQLPRWAVYPATGAFAYWAARGRVRMVAFLCVVLLSGLGATASGSPRPLFAATTGLLLVAGHSGWLNIRGRVPAGLATVGRCSYSVYLMHGLVGVRVWAVCALLGLHPTSGLAAGLMVLLAVAASLCSGWLMYTLVEKPMSRRAAAVSYRR